MSEVKKDVSVAAGFERPRLNDDGSIEASAFTLPFSDLASPQARTAFIAAQRAPAPIAALPPDAPISEIRRVMDEVFFAPLIARQNAVHAVEMTVETIGGVYTQVFIPKAGVSPQNRNRVLINLHGGGFIIGGRSESQIEAIPIAALGRIKVISVDYRMGPEHRFPAASQDVEAVYRVLLESHRPQDIGIYGASAGGVLSGQAVAWFQKVGLPIPGAIGVFAASIIPFGRGDSAHVTPRLGGILPPPIEGINIGDAYYGAVDWSDPLVAPVNSKAVLARFPPTLFVTGTRAGELSIAVRGHLELVKAGVDARLFVWDGMDHGFFGDPDLPESGEAYDVIVDFFSANLGRA